MTQPEERALLDVVAMLAHKGVSMSVQSRNGNLVAVFEDGFYKSDGCAYLYAANGRCYLRARYDEVTEITSLDDVVRCSKEWHDFSHDRFSGWETPPSHWAALYAELGL